MSYYLDYYIDRNLGHSFLRGQLYRQKFIAPPAVGKGVVGIADDGGINLLSSAMDRDMLTRHLAQAEEHIVIGVKNIARQRDLIASLKRDGRDTKEAQNALDQLEGLQTLHIADRERILKELGSASDPEPSKP
jgi:hypothetical protein